MTIDINRLGAPLLVFLDEGAPDEVALLGGKAANLVRLKRWGLTVPRACALTTRAFDVFLDGAGSIAPPLDPEAFDHLDLPPTVLAGLQRFVEETGARRFAVRSSAVAEDSAATSFAGQLETFLDVPCDELALRIRRCFASCFSARVEAYRRRFAAHDTASMAVIVQEMVEPDFAGVMFTVDPVHRDAMAIELVEGLGERLVSGDVTPASYRIDRADLAVTIEYQPFAVPADILAQVTELGLRIERLYGAPQDVEFAVRDRCVHLLQSRPITVLNRAAGG